MRKGMSQGTSRPADYDRNPLNKSNVGGASSQAPHGFTARWTYTVPAGRKAVVTFLSTSVLRITAATAAGQVASSFSYTPNGAGAITMFSSAIYTNGVNDAKYDIFGGQIRMFVGDVLTASDSDTSTGGTSTTGEAGIVFEYDL